MNNLIKNETLILKLEFDNQFEYMFNWIMKSDSRRIAFIFFTLFVNGIFATIHLGNTLFIVPFLVMILFKSLLVDLLFYFANMRK